MTFRFTKKGQTYQFNTCAINTMRGGGAEICNCSVWGAAINKYRPFPSFSEQAGHGQAITEKRWCL